MNDKELINDLLDYAERQVHDNVPMALEYMAEGDYGSAEEVLKAIRGEAEAAIAHAEAQA